MSIFIHMNNEKNIGKKILKFILLSLVKNYGLACTKEEYLLLWKTAEILWVTMSLLCM